MTNLQLKMAQLRPQPQQANILKLVPKMSQAQLQDKARLDAAHKETARQMLLSIKLLLAQQPR